MEEVKFELDTNIVLALLVVFILLKITKLVAWSWLWILSPLWIPIVFALLIIVINKIISLFRKNEDDGTGMSESDTESDC